MNIRDIFNLALQTTAAVPSQLNYPFFVYENIIDTDGNKPYDSYDCSRVSK
jgi:hypothetical protein